LEAIMARSLVWLGALVGGVALVGCSAASSGGYASGSGEGAGSPSPGGASGSGGGTVQAGQLTAGAWDDNRNFDFFSRYAKDEETRLGIGPLFAPAARTAARDAALAPQGAKTDLDVAFVLDTTGSMGDELRYLQVELQALAADLSALFPAVRPRWALVAYKDHGDRYVTDRHDFTADAKTLQGWLDQQQADGGGDFPEAVPEALEDTASLSWRAGSAARVAFWVADAPAHGGMEGRVSAAVQASQQRGVHVYPVASSGVDATAEYQMRSAAQLTGGRYLFLTDDSGIGNAHKEPTIPCYFVTKLRTAIVRMIRIELTGAYAEPDAKEIVRTGGDPKDGRCTLSGGEQVSLY
jgi:hypothetical protein